MHSYFTAFLFLISGFLFSQSNHSISAIPKDLIDNANSVLMNETIAVDVSKEERLRYSHRIVRAVLNKKGNNHVQTYVNYNEDTKVTNLEAFVYDGDGNELKHFKKRDFHDVSAAGNSLYEDDRMLYIEYTPSQYPYIIEFTHEIESKTTAFIPKWFPIGNYWRSTMQSTYTLKFDPLNKPRFKTLNLDRFDISISESPTEIICKAKNVEAIRWEEHSLPFQTIAPRVSFALNRFYLKGVEGYGKNWKEFGDWYHRNLLTNVSDLPEMTIETVRNLVSNEKDNLSKAKKIYEYLQNKVRYISIQIGVGGWKPMLAKDVDKLSYGDCKALTNYTKALLEAVGVPSYYTVLYAGNEEQSIPKDFVAVQGNHAILGIPHEDDIVWLECTSQDAPFGFGGDFSDDRDVLIITPEGGKIVHTKAYSYQENSQENKATIFIESSGALRANFEGISKGLQYDDKYLLENEEKDDLEEHYKERWDYINGFSIDDIRLENNRESIIFSEKLSLVAPNYMSKVGEDLLFCPNVFNQLQYIPPRIKERKQKLHLREGFEDFDTLEITLPEGYVLEVVPENKSIENKFGNYSIEFEKTSENTLRYKRNLSIKKGTFPASEYDNYRSFRRKIAKLDKTKVLLKQKQ